MSARARVLLIDDDEDFRISVKTVLEAQGYEVCQAGSAKEGLQTAGECKPDVILLDVVMECDSAGYGVSQAIKHQEAFEEIHNVPVIMLSSIPQSPDELFAMCPEAEMIRPDRYLTKPVDVPVLLDVVERAVSDRRAQAVRPQ